MTHPDDSTTNGTPSQEWTFGPVPPVARAMSPYRTPSEEAPAVDTAPPTIAHKGRNPLLGLAAGLIFGCIAVLLGWWLEVKTGLRVSTVVPLAALGLRLLIPPRR